MDKYSLFQILKIIEEKDSNTFRTMVFNNLKNKYTSVRLSESLYNASPIFFKVLCLNLYYIRTGIYLPTKQSKGVLGIYRYNNEKHALLNIPIKQIIKISFRVSNFKNLLTLFKLLLDKKFQRILFNISKTNNFLVACRKSETIAYYYLYKIKFKVNDIKTIAVASDSNPYAIAALAVAKLYGLNTIYTNHGYIPNNPPRLIARHNILDCPPLASVYKCNQNDIKIYYKGLEGNIFNDTFNFEKKPTIGIFLSIVPNIDKLIFIINYLVKSDFKVLVRIHPNAILKNKKLIKILSCINITISDSVCSIEEDLKKIDIHIAANSSTHLTALNNKIPSIYINDLDYADKDFYNFTQSITFNLTDITHFSLERIEDFYNSKKWNERFKQYQVQKNYTLKDLEII